MKLGIVFLLACGLPAIASAQAQLTTVPCHSATGAAFNLEPRVNAVAQNEPVADFLLNRVAPNDDLIVQVANDWRGNETKGVKWDGSVSGYYVHRSTVADCSVQFEGGLPAITLSGTTYTGIGNTVIAADPARDAFFAADSRLGSSTLVGPVGLFRVPAATLLNTTACPNGTHTATQAASCWSGGSAVILTTAAFEADPALAVDERPTGTGAGAGDVYVAAVGSANGNFAILLAACTNSLQQCSQTVAIAGASPGFEYANVRPDGLLTLSWATQNSDGSGDIFFVTCTPAGAPSQPTCTTPVDALHVASPINSGGNTLYDLQNINLLTFTYPKQATRAEALGQFTTFLVYDDCKNPLQGQVGPTCLNSEVMLISSKDNGKTWSTPVSVNPASGHHFMPAIYTDPSTGIVHVAYYSAENDPFNHRVEIMRNQIMPGSFTAGSPQAVTTVLEQIDPAPQESNEAQFDFFMGIVARGTGATGQSHLYVSFDSTAESGIYNGEPLPELNNTISGTTY